MRSLSSLIGINNIEEIFIYHCTSNVKASESHVFLLLDGVGEG